MLKKKKGEIESPQIYIAMVGIGDKGSGMDCSIVRRVQEKYHMKGRSYSVLPPAPQ